jgi:hypothetical protein
MKLEVDFPVNGLPEDRELVGIERRVPSIGEYFFNGQKWSKVLLTFSSTWITAILKPKEVWLPCTPEDAFAKMLYPESRVIRTTVRKTLVEKVLEIDDRSMVFKLEGHPLREPGCAYYLFEVLKTEELS